DDEAAGGRRDLQERRAPGGDARWSEPREDDPGDRRPRFRRQRRDRVGLVGSRTDCRQPARFADGRSNRAHRPGAGARRAAMNGTNNTKRTKHTKKTLRSGFVSFVCVVVFVGGCAPKTRYAAPTIDAPPAFKENANWKPPEPRDAEIRGAWWEM